MIGPRPAPGTHEEVSLFLLREYCLAFLHRTQTAHPSAGVTDYLVILDHLRKHNMCYITERVYGPEHTRDSIVKH